MRRRPLLLNALRTFEAVARHGSLTGAAGELYVTPSAVSHQLRALEAGLRISLLEKGKRKVSLTRAGEQLYADSLPPARSAAASERSDRPAEDPWLAVR